MIEIQNISKNYDGKIVLDNISFTMGRGESAGYIGPAGAGKTTTIKIITGLVKPDTGQILINRLNYNTHGAVIKKQFVYIPQEINLYGRLTPMDYLESISRIYQIPVYPLSDELHRLSVQLKLNNIMDKPLSGLAKDIKRKLLLYSAFVIHPPVMILDEPFDELDVDTVDLIKQQLIESVKDGKTIFLSARSDKHIRDICRSIIHIQDGKINPDPDISGLSIHPTS